MIVKVDFAFINTILRMIYEGDEYQNEEEILWDIGMICKDHEVPTPDIDDLMSLLDDVWNDGSDNSYPETVWGRKLRRILRGGTK